MDNLSFQKRYAYFMIFRFYRDICMAENYRRKNHCDRQAFGLFYDLWNAVEFFGV